MKKKNNFRNLAEVLLAHSENRERGIRFIEEDSDVFLSYYDLWLEASGILDSLRHRGVEAGAEIVLQSDRNEQFLKIFWACILGGYLPVPVQTASTPESAEKLKKIWNKLNTPVLIAGGRPNGKKRNTTGLQIKADQLIFADELTGTTAETTSIPADYPDTAFIQFTSGSVGDPKGIILRHHQILANLNSFLKRARYTGDDNPISWMPLTHDMGLIGFHIAPMLMGSNHAILETGLFIRRPQTWLHKATQYRSSILNATTSSLAYFMKHFKKEKAHSIDLSHVRLLFNGAEPVSEKTSNAFFGLMKNYGLRDNTAFPVYGLAEATLAVTFPDPGDKMNTVALDRKKMSNFNAIGFTSDDSGSPTFVSLGYPIDGIELRIADPEHNPLPEKTIGFVEIKGLSITGGYYNEPEKTRDTITGDGWLNTGDLGFLMGHRLYITGRFKDIIFKNGQNIYSDDLESVIREMEEIGPGYAVIVGLHNPEIQEDEIILFIRSGKKDAGYLKELFARVSDHLIQRTGLLINKMIAIKRIPKTSSGKIQRYILREEYKKGRYRPPEFIVLSNSEIEPAPASDTGEKKHPEPLSNMIHLFSENLPGESIRGNSNFFRCGGNSLQAAALISQIRNTFLKSIEMAEFFSDPTPEGVLRTLRNPSSNNDLPEKIPAAKNIMDHAVLPTQKRIYFLSMFRKDCIAYNIPFAFEIQGDLNEDIIQSSIEQLMARHDNLRLSFHFKNDSVTAMTGTDLSLSLRKKRISEDSVKEEVDRFIQPFRLDQPPLFRTGIFTISRNRHLMVFDFHHLIMDGFSIGIFLKELFEFYNGSAPEKLNHPFGDYLNWRKSDFFIREYDRQRRFWLKKLQNPIGAEELPLDFRRPAVRGFNGNSIHVTLGEDFTKGLALLSRNYQCTEFSVFLAVYILFLHKLTGDHSPVTGIPVLGRPDTRFERTMGMFVNILPFRVGVNRNKSIAELFSEVKKEIAVSFMNSFYQFDDFLDKQTDMSRSPLFDTLLVYHNWNGDFKLPGNLEMKYFPIRSKSSKFDFSLNILPVQNERYLSFEYSTDLFRKETIEQFSDLFFTLLKETVDKPERLISDITEQ